MCCPIALQLVAAATILLIIGSASVLNGESLPPLPARNAVWSDDTLIVSEPGDQGLFELQIASDGNSGAFIVWQDRLISTMSIQKIDADGNVLWPQAVPVAAIAGERFWPSAVADGSGGVIVAWVEARSGGCGRNFKSDCDIYAQRFDADGVALWATDGVPVVVAQRNQGIDGIALAGDGNGGVYAAWEDARPPECCKVYAQYLDATGQPQWADGGIRVSPEPTIAIGPMPSPPQMVTDDEGGAIIVWINNQIDPLDEPPPLQAQRIDASGSFLWPGIGVVLGETGSVLFATTEDMYGGVLVAFVTSNGPGTFLSNVIVQRVSGNGATMWGAGGVRAAESDYFVEAPDVVSDGDGGAIVAWVHNTFEISAGNDSDIRMQRVDKDGEVVWTAGGEPICVLDGDQDNPRVVADGAGGALVAWKDCRGLLDRDSCFADANLYVQHLNAAGDWLRLPQGEPVSKAAGSQGVGQGLPVRESTIQATTDMAGGAILTWPDGRNGFCTFSVLISECDVYAQRTNTNLLPPSPCADANGDGARTALDALIALNAAVGLTACDFTHCDIDGDGMNSATDALGILNVAVGLPVDLSCPSE